MFVGAKCPYCNKVFTDQDDIVVCPECGTPHHRSCYFDHNQCANQSLHGSFEWHNTAVSADQQKQTPAMIDPLSGKSVQSQAQQPESDICPYCGMENPYGDKYCRRCGHPLPSYRSSREVLPDNRPTIVVQQISLDERIDGIPIRDWLIYLGSTGVSNIRTFLKQNAKNGSLFGFSVGALFFPFLYFLYYKVWGVSLAVLIIDLLLNLPAILLQANYPLASLLSISPSKLMMIANTMSYVYLGLIAILSLFSKTIVRRNAAKKIKDYRRSCTNEEEYMELLKSKSCPNKMLMTILMILYILSMFFVLFT
jgi:hypothetical protein